MEDNLNFNLISVVPLFASFLCDSACFWLTLQYVYICEVSFRLLLHLPPANTIF